MKVKDILLGKKRGVVTTTAETRIAEAMAILIEHKISCLPVLDHNNQLIGIVSDKDIFLRIHQDGVDFHSCPIGDIMTTELIIGVPDDEIAYVAGLMTENRIRHIPILDGSQLKGMVSVGDIVKTQMLETKIENRYLKQYIEGSYPG
jgi:CBS domain-containing protein